MPARWRRGAARGREPFRSRRGARAERVAALVLRLKGFAILARGHRAPQGEIDIVARRGRLLVFVEVKARRDADLAAHALGARQRARIVRAAAGYLAARPRGALRRDGVRRPAVAPPCRRRLARLALTD